MSNNKVGALYGLGAALLFGLTTPLIKLFLPDSNLLPLAGLLYLGAGLGLGLLEISLAQTRTANFSSREASIQRTDWSLLLGMIVLGGILGPLLMLYGLHRISAVAGSLLLNLEAPLTIILAVTLFREHLGPREAAAALVIFAGAGILSFSSGTLERAVQGAWLGMISIGGACVCWGMDNNLTQKISLRNPIAVARVKGLSAGAFSLGLSWILGYELPDMVAGLMIMGVGFAGYGVSVVLDIYALRLIGAAREAAYFATAPFIGAFAAVPILGEGWEWWDVIAGGVMAIGIGILLSEHHRHMHVHPEMDHDHLHVHTDPHHHHTHEEDGLGAHAHVHRHLPLHHNHAHVSDLHHRHTH